MQKCSRTEVVSSDLKEIKPIKKSEFWHIFSKLSSKSLDLFSEILKNCISPKTDVQIKI